MEDSPTMVRVDRGENQVSPCRGRRCFPKALGYVTGDMEELANWLKDKPVVLQFIDWILRGISQVVFVNNSQWNPDSGGTSCWEPLVGSHWLAGNSDLHSDGPLAQPGQPSFLKRIEFRAQQMGPSCLHPPFQHGIVNVPFSHRTFQSILSRQIGHTCNFTANYLLV
ncbi:hypothetical protein P7K49_028392 [Saguinus oedipus]|uniref:Urea transporter 1 n=1 Tax=Saguinus oedipus TaxID=9490 RepID=A0ABQ9UC53_SAGOE|nr:hypothetical protein P7K49_028392 [Saguinus oedipus]